MDDLVQWLGQQLDEDERIARRAGDSFRQIGETGVIVATEGDRAEECASANWAGVAEHIVAHDPARVLREIDAKRQIIALHHQLEDAQEMLDFCATCDATGKYPEYPCTTLRFLALPYADRPGYQDDWRP
ncbi:DUF6221 family protein [Streptomyces pseudogriseolus]|uniref:DUF6221 family protein n=1 Tax=Streptomyces pseudogriseolus TaxID=36817 RepID=UPI003FA2FE9F